MVSYEVHRGLNLRINCEINECKKEESIIRRFVPILEKSAVFLIWVLLVTTLFSGVIGSAAQNMKRAKYMPLRSITSQLPASLENGLPLSWTEE